MSKRPTIRYKKVMQFRRWSADDDAEIRALALSGDTLEDIAGKLQRTASAVKQRAVRLKLSLSQNPTIRKKRNQRNQEHANETA